jgi:hypothetical protein
MPRAESAERKGLKSLLEYLKTRVNASSSSDAEIGDETAG